MLVHRFQYDTMINDARTEVFVVASHMAVLAVVKENKRRPRVRSIKKPFSTVPSTCKGLEGGGLFVSLLRLNN